MTLDQSPVTSLEAEDVSLSPADDASPGAASRRNLGVMTAALAVAACGEGSGTSTGLATVETGATAQTAATTETAGTKTPDAAQEIDTLGQTSRFLGQATLGTTRAEITAVQSSGYAAWIDAQFATPRATTHWDWLVAQGFNATANQFTQNGFNQTVWRQLISSNDQLRQRVGLALFEILVVGIDGLNTSWAAFATAAHYDILLDNAFGNYRDIIGKVSTSTAMGTYLTFLGNRKANTTTGAQPDENYARELMQLFTIGLYKLNQDGSVQMNGTVPAESYVPADVSGLARVFTGWNFDSNDASTPDRHRRPMVQVATNHELGVKSFLGKTIPAGTDGVQSLKIALDTIFEHANVPPFVSKQLIQRLVKSNPSPAYVERVANVFANNGAGVRGDMKAVIKAILLDPEARLSKGLGDPAVGKLREPVIRLVNWARTFGVTSASEAWGFGDTSSPSSRLGQSVGRSPSVFNFFRPGYSPPNTAISAAGLVAPEFQITNEPTVVAYVNYMQSLIQNGAGDAKANYTDILTKATDSQALIDELNLVLAGNQLSSATIATIKTAVDAISATTTNGPANRVYTAILLTMASPDYLVQK
jgi:uncharacterized protein (DUF1800 family)